MTQLEKELEATGLRYREVEKEDGSISYEVCYDHSRDSFFEVSSQCTAEVWEDGNLYYVDTNKGMGAGEYPKADWTLLDAIKDQCEIE